MRMWRRWLRVRRQCAALLVPDLHRWSCLAVAGAGRASTAVSERWRHLSRSGSTHPRGSCRYADGADRGARCGQLYRRVPAPHARVCAARRPRSAQVAAPDSAMVSLPLGRLQGAVRRRPTLMRAISRNRPPPTTTAARMLQPTRHVQHSTCCVADRSVAPIYRRTTFGSGTARGLFFSRC